jgi:DNA primase
MRIPESKIAEIADAADIVEVISGYVRLQRTGKDYRGLCPFHGDSSPSFYVSPQKRIFHCFGCATGGSVFNFIMKIENMTFVEAAKLLATRYGVPLRLDAERKGSPDERSRLLRALRLAHTYYEDNLKPNQAARSYLADRGVPEEWIERLGLGYATESWDGVLGCLNSAEVHMSDALSAGLIRLRNGGGYYDYFRSRIMIPIRDLSGDLVAFGGRIFGEHDSKSPKYLNSPESSIFRKRGTLYGFDSAREAIRREGYIIVVEGYFDQISLRMKGLENCVAPLGTALGSEQVRLMKRFSSRITTVFDGDEAGLRAVKRSIPVFLSEGLEPDCVILTQDKDPDEAIRRLGADGFRRLLEHSGSMIDFLLDSVRSQYDLNTLQGRNLALEECKPVLRQIADSKERDYLIEKVSSRIRVREDRIRRMLTVEGARRQDSAPTMPRRRYLFDFPADERNVVRGMLLREGYMDRVLDSGTLKDLEDPILSRLARMMVDHRDMHHRFDPLSFCHALEDEELASLVAAWLQPKREEDDLRPEVDGERTLDQSLDRIRCRKLERRKAEIQERMKHCSDVTSEFSELARELRSIAKRLRK